jgi:hypothetical protein
VGRPERASPAEGAADLHATEQARIVAEAFADPPALPSRRNAKKTEAAPELVTAGSNGQPAKPVTKRTTKSRS